MSGLFDQVVNYSPPLLTAGQVNYDGTWNAALNVPTLIDPPDALSKGDYYVVSVAGNRFGLSFAVGDWIISNGTAWEKVDLTDAVSSVFGRTGAVVGVSTDYSAVGLTNTAIGASSPSTGAFTSLSSSSTTTLNGTTIPASKTLVVTTDKLSALAATTSAELAGVISDETGSGALVFATSPTLVTPALGTPSALVGTNITGTASGLTAGNVTTNANLTGAITSVGNATSLGSFSSANLASALTDETGSGANVFATSPTLVTPILGTPQSGTLTSCTGLPISTGVSGLGTGIATALAINTGSAGAPVLFNGALGTPTSGTVTNLTGTASININGTVGATTPSTVAATTITTLAGAVAATGDALALTLRQSGDGGVSMFFTNNVTNLVRLSGTVESAGAGTDDGLFVIQTATNGVLAERGRFTSTGLNSTAIGATTPATGAFTTLYQGTAGAQGLNAGFSGAAGQGFTLRDTTNSRTYFVTTETATGLQINAGANPISLLASSVAVTGALSATGNFIAGTTSGVGGRVEANGGSGQNGVGAYTPTAANSCVAAWNAATSGDNVFVSFFTETSITARGTINYNRAGNLVRYNTTSDQNLKTNIRPLINSGALIDRLQPRIFDWKAEGHNTDNAGFIAQEVFEVFPDAVSKGSDTYSEAPNYKQWSMDAGKFMPLVVAELKSLRARVAALESK